MPKRGTYIQVRVPTGTKAQLEKAVPQGELSKRMNEVAQGLTLRQATWLLYNETKEDSSLPLKERFATLWVTPQSGTLLHAESMGMTYTKLLRASALQLAKGSKGQKDAAPPSPSSSSRRGERDDAGL